MSELSYNLLWTWDYTIRSLFRRLDEHLWKQSGYNPVLMLGRVPQAILERSAVDPRFIAGYRRACDRYDTYMRQQPRPADSPLIAYFSMEYGLADCMPIYSGGLGLLSGDHLKASSDAEIPLVAVGLLYQKGYLQQSLNPDGWQQERNPVNDFYTLPVQPVMREDGSEVHVSVTLPSGPVYIKLWRMQVGRVDLYLLDTNIAENERVEHREITDQLYGGDVHVRMRQEVVLGIGGLRALEALNIQPTVYHMNEGHSAFLSIERIRLLIERQNLNFEEALDACRANGVFTTHTSVPAGIDLFDPGLIYDYFGEYCRASGIPFDDLLALGRTSNSHQDRFSMAILAFKTAAFRNAVSRLHRQVSQEMWQGLWPKLPVWEVPITSITNGVHLPTWLSGDLAQLYDRHLQPDWRERFQDPKVWELVDDIPSKDLWEAHRRNKRMLIAFVRERACISAVNRKASTSEQRRLNEVLDPEAFTIGFARRFATYKRATLLFRDVSRLKRLLMNHERPVQIVIAGKAHPKDQPGKLLIREIVQLSRDPEISQRIIFLEDYSIQVARELVRGVDLWLNNPRRGEEACGTSGMKAGLNGVLNLSVLDGWFDEAYEYSGGWAIGDRDEYGEEQDEIHARAIYSTLENDILPVYFSRADNGVPEEWVRRMKLSLMNLSPAFNCHRMVTEYMTQLYEPAHQAHVEISHDAFEPARERTRWNHDVNRLWARVNFVELGPGPDNSVLTGRPVPMRAVVELAGLTPKDVRVEAVVGRVSISGTLEDTQVMKLDAVEQRGTAYVFSKEFVPHQTGRLGYSLRVSPNHYDDPLTRPCNALLTWGNSQA